MTSLDRLVLLGQFGLLVLQAAITGFMWVMKRSFVSRPELDAISGRVGLVEAQSALLRQRADGAPGHGDIADLTAKISAVATQLGTLNGRLDGLDRNVSLVLETLLEERK